MIILSDWFTNHAVLAWFVKAFTLVFSLMYLLFAIVIYKQTQIMTKTVQSDKNGLIYLGSLIQIVIGIILLIWAVQL
ncbi:hypothetical protein M1523_02740 [Patescibacteria group bacterium]|nr:hypothetical protein [Patescibacteria group bacterium]MCL5091361.1 hypothetical protein [Patescibacteria group bacterium]